MSQNRSIPQYKTLDIIKFYTQVYEFVNKYLIFVFAAFLSIIVVGILWIWQPSTLQSISINNSTWYKAYHQEVGLLHPLNFYAAKELVFDKSSKIYALGWPIWSQDNMINSINNIVQYNGIILPRQISRSAWVPHFESEIYSEAMITTLLKGMGDSQVNLMDISDKLTKPQVTLLEDWLIKSFGLSCTNRNLTTFTFCDLKLSSSINSRYHYNLTNSVSELPTIHDYIFTQSNNDSLKQMFCDSMVRQYRYEWNGTIKSLLRSCSQDIINESEDIAQMKEINQEIDTGQITNKVYSNPIMNRYKLMSIYQYLMRQINNNEFADEKDTNVLISYNSFITNLGNQWNIKQPYGDIILVFHQLHLIPWLDGRDSFASTSQRELTKQLIATTKLLINWDASIGFSSIGKWPRLTNSGDLITGSSLEPTSRNIIDDDIIREIFTWDISQWFNSDNSGNTTNSWDIIGGDSKDELIITEQTPIPTLTWLIMSVIGVTPQSITKRWNLVIVKFSFSDIKWIVAINTTDKWSAQLYYESDVSGATKITHPALLFKPSNQETIHGILEWYIQNQLISGWTQKKK